MAGREPVIVTTATLRGWPLPKPGENKDARGCVLVVGGSSSTPGAVRLSGEAALRSGAGKLMLATVASGVPALAVATPEASVHAMPETSEGNMGPESADLLVELAEGCDAVLFGPGLVDVEHAVDLLSAVLPRLGGKVVIDALASAFITVRPERLRELECEVVLTLNPKELSSTLKAERDAVEKDPLTAAAELARRCGAVVLCGGRTKSVAAPDGRAWLAEVGGPGLGVSGSGDVQSGVVTGLWARGADPAQAAVWGGYLHGRAGERLSARVGTVGFLAREIPAEVPQVLSELLL
jgi:ADP-dependent NAD(P)H-hydrate dehydratase